MVQGFREEIAKKPDAISFMGHPGNGAIHPLTIQAQKAGIFGSLPGPMMMFSGGEIGIEDLLPQLAKLKAGPVWQHGEVSWWCSDDTPKNVFGLTRTLGNASVSLVANIGDEPANFSPTRSLVGVEALLTVGSRTNLNGSVLDLGPNSAIIYTHNISI